MCRCQRPPPSYRFVDVQGQHLLSKSPCLYYRGLDCPGTQGHQPSVSAAASTGSGPTHPVYLSSTASGYHPQPQHRIRPSLHALRLVPPLHDGVAHGGGDARNARRHPPDHDHHDGVAFCASANHYEPSSHPRIHHSELIFPYYTTSYKTIYICTSTKVAGLSLCGICY